MSDHRQTAGDAWRDKLEARLRGLPSTPVPAGLEAKLLDQIPEQCRPFRHGRPLLWRAVPIVAGFGLVAAGVFLAVLVFERTRPPELANDPRGRTTKVVS